jgi:hypothetical protein
MVARNEVGVDPRAVLDYVGAQFSFLPCFQAPRRPTFTDIRPQFSLWRVGTNSPSQVLLNGVIGEFWYLSYYNTTGQAIWLPISSGTSGGILDIAVPNGTSPVFPTGLGTLSFTSSLGTVIITGSANNIDFNVVTGTSAIDKVEVDASTPPGTNPVLPFGNQITIEGGATFATGTRAFPILTNSLAANTIDLQIQLAGGNAAVSTPNNFGVSQFDTNQFLVVGGFVQLKGGGVNPALTSLAVQTGTSPVVPTFTGQMIFNGAVVAAGVNPVRTDGTGPNTVALEVQISQAIAATDVSKIGLAAFNSTEFTVDANGFVSLSSGAGTVTALAGNDTLTVVPTAGTINLLAAVVVNGTDPAALYVKRTAASTETIDIQVAAANAASLITNAGIASFNSTEFTVDANGYVSLVSGGVALETLTGNSGGAISPVTGNINTVGAGSITIVGAGNTLTTELQGLTQYDVLVGQGTTTIGLITPSATSGIPLISQGSAAYPIFGTAVVAGGGTGDVSFTPYAVITGGTTSTSPLQSIASVGTTGQVLTSNGAGALPTFQTSSSTGAVTNFTVDTTAGGGVNPVVPNGSGNIIITSGPLFATGTEANSLRTDTTAANKIAIELQLAGTSNGLTPITDNYGVAQFNNANFTVSAGLVTPLAITINTAGSITGGGTVNLGGSITITGGAGVFPWSDKAVSFNAVSNNGYFITAALTSTLPSTPAEGDTIDFIVDTASNLTIQANTGQKIRLARTISAAAGIAVNTQIGDSISLVYRVADTTWLSLSANGGWNIT